MNWLDKLEGRYGRWGMEGLMRHVCLLMLVVFFLDYYNLLQYHVLYLNRTAIMHGQIWRLFTFLLIPASPDAFRLFFELSILVMCADGLESHWGTFKLTVYYLIGALLCIIASLFMPDIQLGSYFIYLSLFLGFATISPNSEILFMALIPIKIKYMAMLSVVVMIYQMILAPMHMKIAIVIAIGNYLLFFAGAAFSGAKRNYYHSIRSAEFSKACTKSNDYRHRCSVCGKTDVSDPNTLFRYCTCAQCGNNGVAFCDEHLKQHKSTTSGN